jgi:hypothetical protein
MLRKHAVLSMLRALHLTLGRHMLMIEPAVLRCTSAFDTSSGSAWTVCKLCSAALHIPPCYVATKGALVWFD